MEADMEAIPYYFYMITVFRFPYIPRRKSIKSPQVRKAERNINSRTNTSSNDQDKLFDKSKTLEKKWETAEGLQQRVGENIREEEKDHEVGEGPTHVSDLTRLREDNKQIMVDDHKNSLNENSTLRETRECMVDLISKSTESDVKTLEEIKSNLSGVEDCVSEIDSLLNILKDLKDEAENLKNEFSANDLPPLELESYQRSSNKPYQDSSDVYKTDYDSWEPGDE